MTVVTNICPVLGVTSDTTNDIGEWQPWHSDFIHHNQHSVILSRKSNDNKWFIVHHLFNLTLVLHKIEICCRCNPRQVITTTAADLSACSREIDMHKMKL